MYTSCNAMWICFTQTHTCHNANQQQPREPQAFSLTLWHFLAHNHLKGDLIQYPKTYVSQSSFSRYAFLPDLTDLEVDLYFLLLCTLIIWWTTHHPACNGSTKLSLSLIFISQIGQICLSWKPRMPLPATVGYVRVNTWKTQCSMKVNTQSECSEQGC